MIRYNEFLVLLRGKNIKIRIYYSGQAGEFGFGSGLTQKFTGFSGSVYFGFGARKSCSEPKSFGRVWVESPHRVNF